MSHTVQNNEESENSMVLSSTGKYKAEILPDNSATFTRQIWNSKGHQSVQINKYQVIRLTRVETNEIVFEFKQYISCALGFAFFVQTSQETGKQVEWFLGSREYMSQIFVNLETGEYYDNCCYDLDDSEYERKYGIVDPTYNDNDDDSDVYNDEFIWAIIKFSDDGNLLSAHGCHWGGPYYSRLYDISDIKNGWREIKNSNELLEYNDTISFNANIVQYVRYIGPNTYPKSKEPEHNIIVMECKFDSRLKVLTDMNTCGDVLLRLRNEKIEAINKAKKEKQKKAIEQFCQTNNVFKDWICGKPSLFCEIINTSANATSNASKLLSVTPDDIISATCHGKYSGNEYESHLINFVSTISTDNIQEVASLPHLPEGFKYINAKHVSSFETCGLNVVHGDFYIEDPNGNRSNRLLSEQIGILTCSIGFGTGVHKSMLENIGLIFTFCCKNKNSDCADDTYTVKICVEVFLTDGENDMRLFSKDSIVRVTIS